MQNSSKNLRFILNTLVNCLRNSSKKVTDKFQSYQKSSSTKKTFTGVKRLPLIKSFMALAVLISISAVGATFQHNIIGQSETDQLCSVTLTDDLFSRLDQNYSNIAIIDQNGNQIPAQLRRKQKQKIDEPIFTDIQREYPISAVRLGPGEWGLSLKNQPINTLKIATNSQNFIRMIELRESTSSYAKSVSQIKKLNMLNLKENNTEVKFPETHCFSLNLKQTENDFPSDDISKISAFGPEYEMIFLQRPGHTYQLIYGDGVKLSAASDSALLNRLISERKAVIQLNYGTYSPHKVSAITITKRILFSETVLTILLLTGIIMVSIYLFRNIKKVDDRPEPL